MQQGQRCTQVMEGATLKATVHTINAYHRNVSPALREIDRELPEPQPYLNNVSGASNKSGRRSLGFNADMVKVAKGISRCLFHMDEHMQLIHAHMPGAGKSMRSWVDGLTFSRGRDVRCIPEERHREGCCLRPHLSCGSSTVASFRSPHHCALMGCSSCSAR